MKLVLCIVIIVVVLVIYQALRDREEDFATVREKATALSQWMRAHPRATYREFISENPESNQVEYMKLRTQAKSLDKLIESLKI